MLFLVSSSIYSQNHSNVVQHLSFVDFFGQDFGFWANFWEVCADDVASVIGDILLRCRQAGQRRKVGPAAADEILSADAPCFISQVPMVLLQTWIYFRFVETKLSETQLEPHFLQEFVGEGLTQAMS